MKMQKYIMTIVILIFFGLYIMYLLHNNSYTPMYYIKINDDGEYVKTDTPTYKEMKRIFDDYKIQYRYDTTHKIFFIPKNLANDTIEIVNLTDKAINKWHRIR